jgi:NADPH:quinone reductase-like Zn-dependent oxidoreductase
MRAAVIHRYGGNDVVAVETVADPAVGARDVLIEARAASVNPVDFKLRNGMLRMVRKFAFPLALGFDVSGVVARVGPAVTRFKPGDQVFASLDGTRPGTFAELVAADEGVVAIKPQTLSHIQSAAIPLVGLTSWQALTEEAKVTGGSKVLIHAGAGGIGTIAIQLARHLGAEVATTTSTKNIELVTSLGANLAIDYTRQDFTKIISGYDVVFETLGGDVEMKSFAVLRRGGTLVSIASLPDVAWARANGLNPILTLGLGVLTLRRTLAARRHGVMFRFLFKRSDGAQLAMLAGLADQGKLEPLIDQIYPLDRTADALAHVESGHARGKVVIQVK